MKGHTVQKALLCRLRRMDFLNSPIRLIMSERNRPLHAIQARYGLLRTSMSVNCWMTNGLLRKSQSPTQDSCVSIFEQYAHAKFGRAPFDALIHQEISRMIALRRQKIFWRNETFRRGSLSNRHKRKERMESGYAQREGSIGPEHTSGKL